MLILLDMLSPAERRDLANSLLRAAWSAALELDPDGVQAHGLGIGATLPIERPALVLRCVVSPVK